MRFIETPHPDATPVRAFLFILTILMFSAGGAFAQDTAVSEADTSATQSVVGDQLEAFKAGELDRAYSHAGPNIKRIFPTTDAFTAMVRKGYDPLFNPGGFTFGRNTFQQGEIYQEVIVTDSAGKQWQAVYTLKQQEDGSWKITGVKMNPYKGASV